MVPRLVQVPPEFTAPAFNFTFPATSNFSAGAFIPTPIFPPEIVLPVPLSPVP